MITGTDRHMGKGNEMPQQRRPAGGDAEQDWAEPSAMAADASSREKVKTAVVIGAWIGGAVLAVAAGAPAWLGVLYAVIGLFAGAYRVRRARDRRPARARPARGRRPELAAQLALAPSPPPAVGQSAVEPSARARRPSPAARSRSTVARAEAATVTALPWPAGPATAEIPATAVSA